MYCGKCGKLLPDEARFCPQCGYEMPTNWRDNKGDKTNRIKGFLAKEKMPAGEKSVKEEKKSPDIKVNKVRQGTHEVGRLFQNLRYKVVGEIDKGEQVDNQGMEPFMFHFQRDTVEIVELDRTVTFDNENDAFLTDSRGHYYVCRQKKEYRRYNGGTIVPEKRYYLNNEDVIVFNNPDNDEIDELFLFSIMDQKDTEWTFCSKDEINSIPWVCEHIKILNQEAVIEPIDNELIYINNTLLKTSRSLKKGDCIMINFRHVIYFGDYIVYQEPLSEENTECITVYGTKLGQEDTLSIDIMERVAKLSGGRSRVLLKDIRLQIAPGEMVLILGSSGAGKTTFFNAVMGTEKANAKIMFGRNNLYSDFDKVRHMIGFVPQFDLLRNSDTVYMTLVNAAQLKTPREFVADERLLNTRIEWILKRLSLEKERDTLVSKLSGGQRKRLSIGVEYVSNPAVFFLDEPDSGLDGSQARVLMKTLRDIADDGKMVLVISHSPDRTRELFDKVVVLAKSEEDNCGRLAFFGGIDEALEFFDVDSVEMIVAKIEETPDDYIRKYGERQ